MALFLANHSPAKIMILGRWKSDAFLVYIRPQVLEWTHSMSGDMLRVPDFADTTLDRNGPEDPILPNSTSRNSNGRHSALVIPTYYLHT